MAKNGMSDVDKLVNEALAARASKSYRRRVHELMKIGTQEVFDAAARALKSKSVRRRRFGADVLSELGYQSNVPPFKTESARLLLGLLRHERDPSVKAAAITALGRLRVREAIPSAAAFVHDAAVEVRWALAAELIGCTWDEGEERTDPLVTATLITLSSDRVPLVRNWACFSLASSDEDSPEIRHALWRHARDRHHDTRMEALRGLARRRDSGVLEPLREAVLAIGYGRLGTWLMDDLVEFAIAEGDQALQDLLTG